MTRETGAPRRPSAWREVTANLLLMAWCVAIAVIVLASLDAETTAVVGGWGVMAAAPVIALAFSSRRGTQLIAIVQLVVSGLLFAALLVGFVGDAFSG